MKNISLHESKKNIKKHQIKKNPIKQPIVKKQQKSNTVYLEIGINDQSIGKIIIQLFDSVVPRTCKNFRELCVGNRGIGYKDSCFHRIISGFMIQVGDYKAGNGTGGASIYGDRFDDENFEILHDQPYLLSMANSGKNTNGSQFFITTGPTPHLDGRHVVFGKVVSGFDTVDRLNDAETDGGDRPIDDILIVDCGIE
jgi:peptidyl-prolyl isomerase D